ncbi:MAG: tRNA pseudouridine(38-40) synthase TruA [Oscillospiraceae bacterium]|jgi:tRNA pseudouridine38-40 synthase|nr:tRNA pseudouridine(38-40) synthase TruA [Oscillospiraceae bacterium]
MSEPRNIALLLSYDGTAYHGWQRQRDLPTVQQTLEDALQSILKHRVSVTGCGRTDAGVHAEYYVANFRTSARIPAERLPFALNSRLPSDVAVARAWETVKEFHATFSCVRKEYTYRILNSEIRDPLRRNHAWWYPQSLDLERMRAAARQFVGTHDFAAVRSTGTDIKSTVRTIFAFDIYEKGGIIEMVVAANGFLYNMVRAMVGTLVYVAIGKLEPPDVRKILETRRRSLAGPTVPPHGLYMSGVHYDI